jgi:hypothetical protein
MPNKATRGETNRVINEKKIDSFNQAELTKETEKAPIFIPDYATRREEIKSSGYHQIKYKWTVIINSRKHTFEARLHTATPYAPVGTPSNWRVTLFVHGTARGEKKRKYELVNVDEQANMWVSAKEWHEAARAFVQQTATEAQSLKTRTL